MTRFYEPDLSVETMSSLPVHVAVFFGKVDKRPSGWYWTPISDGQIPHSGSIAGPFETKAAAVEDAHQVAIRAPVP
jgi:hypothetical protein